MKKLEDTAQQNNLLFGTAGVPPSTPRANSLMGIAQIRHLGLDCMEMAFVRSVRMGTSTATRVKKAASEQQVSLSVHAPYYINLNSPDSSKIKASRERILKAARVGWQCGAHSVVFHAGFYHDDSAEKVFERVKRHLRELTQQLEAEEVSICLRPETTGKNSQFGTLDELLDLSEQIEGIEPCVDFAHLHARSGRDNSYVEFANILERIEKKLGRLGLENMHIHLSGIEYSMKGERKHLMLQEADFKYIELLQSFKDYHVKGCLVCESPNTEEDALLIQRTYHELKQL